MSRTMVLLTVASLFGLAQAAVADPGADVNHASYAATGLEGHPELDAGGVVDVTLGRALGAREHHRVNGAAPHATYEIVGEVYLFTACSPDDPFGPFRVREGTLTTNEGGNGHTTVTFPGEAFDIAPDAFWVRWNLNVGEETAYRSGCVQVELSSVGS